MTYNYVADSFHTEKLYSRLSSSEVTYDDHLRLIGKRLLPPPILHRFQVIAD